MKQFLNSVLLLFLTTIYFTAQAQSGSGWDWASTSGAATYSPGRQVLDITSDANGNVYATGRFQGVMTIGTYTITTSGDGSVNSNFDEDAFVVKYNASGAVQWLKRFGIASIASNQLAQTISLDGSGNVYIGGTGMSLGTVNSAFVVKYDNNGNELWSKTDFALYEINGIGFGVDDNPIVMESNLTSKNIYKLNKNNGAIIWTVTNTNVGTNSTSNYKDFVDAAGNVYYTCYNLSAANTIVAGQSFTTTGLTSYVASVNNNGITRWVQKIDNRQIQLGYTNDYLGNSYIILVGGNGASFQGISTLQATQGGNSYFELDNNGLVTSYKMQSPFIGNIRVTSDAIYSYTLHTNGDAPKGLNGIIYPTPTATTKVGIIAKYGKADYLVQWSNSFEITTSSGVYNASLKCIDVSSNGKIVVGGGYDLAIKFGSTTYTPNSATGFTPTDLYIAQFNAANTPTISSTTWTGNANNMNWNDVNNWNNGVPTANTKAIFNAGATNYPNNITSTIAVAAIKIASGVTISVTGDAKVAGGIENNGVLQINAGFFAGRFATSGTQSGNIYGTGKVVITNSSVILSIGIPSTLYQTLEINCSGEIYCPTLYLNGSLNLINGTLNNFLQTTDVKLFNSNSSCTATATSFIKGTITQWVSTNGTYNFPVGNGTKYAPVSIKLNAIQGTKYLTVAFSSTINGSAPNTTAGGQNVTALLNSGIWTVTPDAALSGGSYNITLEGRGFTNSVTDATRYVVLKRNNSSSAWAFFGNNGTATYASTTITATAGNITSFSDFAIGIATTSVPATLPVSYTYFTAQKSNTQVLLQWQTAQEINNHYFNVQHSNNAIDWQIIGKVNAGNSASVNNYSLTHTQPPNGINYYRLQQVDNDGKISISDVRRVDMNTIKTAFKLYPNPVVTDVVNVDYGIQIITPLNYTIIDVAGKTRQAGSLKKQQESINLSALLKGNYTLIISDGQVVNLIKL